MAGTTCLTHIIRERASQSALCFNFCSKMRKSIVWCLFDLQPLTMGRRPYRLSFPIYNWKGSIQIGTSFRCVQNGTVESLPFSHCTC